MTILKTLYYFFRRWLVLRCNKQEYENHLMITYCTKKENEQCGGDQRKKFLRLIIKCNYRILGSEWRLYKDSIYYWIHALFCFLEKIWNVLSLQKFSLRILFCLDVFWWKRNDASWRHTHSKKMNQEYFPATEA